MTDFGRVGDWLQDGVHALIVPKGDATALARALERIASDAPLRRRLAQAALQKIGNEYSAEACVPRIVDSYRAAQRQRRGLERVKGIEPSS